MSKRIAEHVHVVVDHNEHIVKIFKGDISLAMEYRDKHVNNGSVFAWPVWEVVNKQMELSR